MKEINLDLKKAKGLLVDVDICTKLVKNILRININDLMDDSNKDPLLPLKKHNCFLISTSMFKAIIKVIISKAEKDPDFLDLETELLIEQFAAEPLEALKLSKYLTHRPLLRRLKMIEEKKILD